MIDYFQARGCSRLTRTKHLGQLKTGLLLSNGNVPGASLRAGRSIDGISAEIQFGKNVKEYSPSSNYRYVDVSWIADKVKFGSVFCVLFQPEAKFMAESKTLTKSGDLNIEEYVIPKTLLAKPWYFLFFTIGRTPVAAKAESLTRLAYDMALNFVKGMGGEDSE